MTGVLTWMVEQRVDLEERAELLRKELAGIETQLSGWRPPRWCSGSGPRRLTADVAEPERVVTGPGAGGMRLVPDRVEGVGLAALTSEYRRSWRSWPRRTLR
jgi:hypothetical protein